MRTHVTRGCLTLSTGGDDGSASISTREGSISPNSLASAGTTSLQQEEELGAEGATKTDRMETSCRELLSTIEELAWHHSQVNVT